MQTVPCTLSPYRHLAVPHSHAFPSPMPDPFDATDLHADDSDNEGDGQEADADPTRAADDWGFEGGEGAFGGAAAADNPPDACDGVDRSEPAPEAGDADPDHTASSDWGSGIYITGPGLTNAYTLGIARQQCQDWAHTCGFNLVQKSADQRIGKATFRCSCKGRKFTGGGRDETADPELRRARPTTYALPGDELCPF